jgi:hypothetical protein
MQEYKNNSKIINCFKKSHFKYWRIESEKKYQFKELAKKT